MHDLTLFIDTTTSRLMLALGNNERLLTAQNVTCESHRYHSALMIPAIQDMLTEKDYTVQDLKAVAVNIGPGSFTGLRTGIITARTMAQFLNLPVHCFNTFELLAADSLHPMAIYLDALRDRSYHATLSWGETGPKYWRQPPGMFTFNGHPPEPPMQARLLVSSGLARHFPDTRPSIVPEDFFSPPAMAKLMAQYGERFVRAWQDVLPLYLQEPSITLKKR